MPGFGYGLGFASRFALAAPAAFNPASLGFDRAYDFSAAAATASSTPAAFAAPGGAITWAGSPTLRTGYGPADQKMLETASSLSHVGTMASSYTSPVSSGLYWCWVGSAIGTNGANLARLVADSVSANNYIGIVGARNQISIRNQAMAAAITLNLPNSETIIGTCDIVEVIIGADGSAAVFLNGVAGGTAAAGSVTGSFLFTQFGRGTTNSNINGQWGLTAWKAGGLTTEQRTAWLAYLQPWRTGTWYVATDGVATNTGWNRNNAKSSPEQMQSTSANAMRLRAGDSVVLKDGDNEIYNLSATLLLSSATVPTGVVLRGARGTWGSGRPAMLTASTAPSDWVNVSGNIWSRTANEPLTDGSGYFEFLCDTQATHPGFLHDYDLSPTPQAFVGWALPLVRQYLANPNGQAIYRTAGTQTTPPAGRYGWSSGTLYVQLADGGNPNGRVRVNSRGATNTVPFVQQLVRISQASCGITDLRIWYGSTTAIDLGGSDGTFAQRIDCRYFAQDGIDGVTANSAKSMLDCFGAYFGLGRDTERYADGSPGDFCSGHGAGATFTIRRSVGVGGNKSNFGHTCGGVIDTEWFVSAGGTNLRIFNNDASQGEQRYRNGLVIMNDVNTVGTSFAKRAALDNSGGIFLIQNVTIHAIGSATGKFGVEQVNGTNPAQTTLTNCIITSGFATGVENVSGTLTRTYTINNAATATVGSVSGTTGNSTAAANLANPDNLEFTPNAGSPAIGAGVAISGLTLDLDGSVRPNPPSIGALEPA